ncbi:unnamed protein product, partial [marine sediment metagenome]
EPKTVPRRVAARPVIGIPERIETIRGRKYETLRSTPAPATDPTVGHFPYGYPDVEIEEMREILITPVPPVYPISYDKKIRSATSSLNIPQKTHRIIKESEIISEVQPRDVKIRPDAEPSGLPSIILGELDTTIDWDRVSAAKGRGTYKVPELKDRIRSLGGKPVSGGKKIDYVNQLLAMRQGE